MSISSIEKPIEFPIEQRNTGKGNPNAILTFDVELNNRQKKLLESLPDYDSKVTVRKTDVNMKDLSALTAVTGNEFAMFTKGNERLIVRGSSRHVNIDVDAATELAGNGYKWSGHTHPGTSSYCLKLSDGDHAVWDCFNQDSVAIYNSKGDYIVYMK